MAKRRDLIKMTDAEVTEFLDGRHSLNVATHGPDGRIHLVAMWYGFTPDGEIAFETYEKSQKVRNLERNPQMTCLIETGDDYNDLRGVSMVGTGEIVRDDELKTQIAKSQIGRYYDFGDDTSAIDLAVANLVNKRVGVILHVDKLISWDHSKLGGTY